MSEGEGGMLEPEPVDGGAWEGIVASGSELAAVFEEPTVVDGLACKVYYE